MRTQSLFVKQVSILENHLLDFLKNGFKPTLGIVFCSPKQNFKEITHLFDSYCIDLLGCTTAGEIADETLAEGGISCMLMDISKDRYNIYFERNTEGVFEGAHKLRLLADSSFDNPAMIVCSAGVLNDGEQIVAGLKFGAEKEIPIFGGLAGDDSMILNTYIFTRKDISNDGIATIVFDHDKIELKGLATSGWEPLGGFNTVTKAKDNVIYSINNEPALDFFNRFFGDGEEVGVDNPSLISTQYPFQVVKDNQNEVLRMPIKGDLADKSLRLVGSIKEGDKFRFSISPSVNVINKTIKEFEVLKNNNPEADALILFSCIGRYSAFGPFLEDEVKGIYDQWKKPMIGFLTYGEIGNLRNGICEFHNETCSLVIIKERIAQ